jgi:cytochrome b6-f complex iron-sulfur subunit
MTTKPSPAGETRSRLDPEAVARRDFLGLAAKCSATAAFLFAAIGMVRLPKTAVLPSPSKKFRVTLPESLVPGEPYEPPGRSVAVFRDEQGVYAISKICTHLGCIVNPVPTGFDCPCHGSRFDTNGDVIRGPAPTRLKWLAVARTADNTYLVDEGSSVPFGTKEMA